MISRVVKLWRRRVRGPKKSAEKKRKEGKSLTYSYHTPEDRCLEEKPF